jgi:hypothetical protein
MIATPAETLAQIVRAHIRRIARALASATFGAGMLASGAASPAHAQVGFDRPGGDYSSFAVRSGDPVVCANRCDRDNRCRAWSFAYPTTFGPRAVCWLKSSVPTRVETTCCVSGVRGSGVPAPRGTNSEFEIDRFGGDYRTFDTPANSTGNACAAACAQDNRCRAWTYLRPGYGTASGRCYLKSRVTPPRRRACCISGVVR